MSFKLKCAIVCLCLLNGAIGFADDVPSTNESSPQATLKLAMQSLEQGDAEAYVNCLSEEELRFQAGYVIYLHAVWELVQIYDLKQLDPETRLLSLNLKDLIKKQNQFDDEIHENGHNNFSIALSDFNQHLPENISGLPWMVNEQTDDHQLFRPYCIKLSRKLKDPQVFIADFIQLLANPTLISTQGETIKQDKDFWQQTIHKFKDVQCTYFQRGGYAIAIWEESNRTTVAPPKSTRVETLSNSSTLTTKTQNESSIEFVMQNGEWKINRLFPKEIFEILSDNF